MKEWISVNDRLPEPAEPVLIWNEHLVRPAHYIDGVFESWHESNCKATGAYFDTTTHWMPLPEPPEA